MANILPARPLRIGVAFMLTRGVAGCLAGIGGAALIAYGVIHFVGSWDAQWLWSVMVGGGLIVAAHFGIKAVQLARLAAEAGEEVIVEVLHVERFRERYAKSDLSMEVRRYRFGIPLHGAFIEQWYGAGHPRSRPLFIDAEHRRALALRVPGEPKLLIMRNDLAPFALPAAEERAVRERIEALRELHATKSAPGAESTRTSAAAKNV